MEKVIKFLENELKSELYRQDYAKQISEDEKRYLSDLQTAIITLKNISEKPSTQHHLNAVVIQLVDPCNKSCKICQGKGFVIMDQPTTGISSKHQCTGTGVCSTPFEYIYPEYWPKDMQHQPAPPPSMKITLSK